MADDKQPPIQINISGSGNTVHLNTVNGDAVGFNVTGDENVVVKSSSFSPKTEKSFWHHPATKFVLMVLAGVAVAALVVAFNIK